VWQRRRLIAAMTVLATERGWQDVTVDQVCERAGVSKRSYYELFGDREGCFVAAVEAALEVLCAPMNAVIAGGGSWADATGRALAAWLTSFDADEPRAWLVAVEAGYGSDAACDARRRAFEPFVGLIDRDRGVAPPTGVALVGAVLELIYRHLTGPDGDESLMSLITPAAYLLLSPRLGRDEALRAAGALLDEGVGEPLADVEPEPDNEPPLRITDLTEATLLFLADNPGARNLEIAAAIGIQHESQVSRHLQRLDESRVARKVRVGRANAWELTPVGTRLVSQLRAARDVA
jgi:AcrR family transcriptional regulator